MFVTPGKSATAAEPTVCVHGFPLPFHDWAEQFETGVEAVIVKTRQIPGNCWPAELKCRSRMHYYLADQEAETRQPGARAILLDQDGFVGEGSTANVVAYFADRGLVTPLRSKVLPGVSQEVLYELAASLGVDHCEADLLPAELAKADRTFLYEHVGLLVTGRSARRQESGQRQSGRYVHAFTASNGRSWLVWILRGKPVRFCVRG